MPSGRVLHAGLALLDRQLVDRSGRLCGKVDDLELTEPDESGNIYVAAIITGPGALMGRVGRRRIAGWLRSHIPRMFPSDLADPGRIPFGNVADLGNHVTLSLDDEQLATHAAERWTRDHIIRHIPGSGHVPDQ